MRVIVIGAGIVGVTTAYELASAGLEVAVVERRSGVAQETSFGNAGVVAPSEAAPWAAPGLPRQLMSALFRSTASLVVRPALQPAMWRWLVRFLGECRAERWLENRRRMQRLAYYSRDRLGEISRVHDFFYERTQGCLQLVRRADDLERLSQARRLLEDAGIACEWLDPEDCRRLEPGLSTLTPLAAGLHLPENESGNCPLFASLLRREAEARGARFHFDTAVDALRIESGRVTGVRIGNVVHRADAVVVCAASDSVRLLDPVGLRVPLWPIKGFSATVPLKADTLGPTRALIDEDFKVTITPFGNRVRVAGVVEFGDRRLRLRDSALRTLARVAGDWFPSVARWQDAQYWVGATPMLPDGPPLLGPTPIDRLHLNLGHGATGWAMACGSARIVADLLSGRPPEIDLDGLTLARYSPA